MCSDAGRDMDHLVVHAVSGPGSAFRFRMSHIWWIYNSKNLPDGAVVLHNMMLL